MNCWQVRLKGKESHINEISNLWMSEESSIFKENEDWFLQSTEFDKSTSASDVQNIAESIIKKVNDVFFFYQNTSLVEVDDVVKVDEQGVRHHYVLAKANISAGNFQISASASISPHTETPATINFISSLYNIAITDKSLSDALHFYRKNDWVGLYKVFEIIRDDVGDIKKKNYEGINDRDINRFTGTAQSRAALGDNARHAAKRYSVSNPMEWQEAKNLIKTLIEKWYLSKI